MMPSVLDLGLIGVILLSALLAMLRGFTRETFAVASWGAAALAAYYLSPLVAPYLEPYLSKPDLRRLAAVAIVFVVALLIISITTARISDRILDSRIGALDRSLGFLFGAARGLLLCGIAFIFFDWFVPEKTQPEWVKSARMRPLLVATSNEIKSVIPDNVDGLLAMIKKQRGPATDEPAADTDAAPSPPPRPASNGKRT